MLVKKKKKKKQNIENPQTQQSKTYEPRILVVADHGAVLLFALTKHKSLKNVVLSIALLKQQISIPFVHENIH